MPKSIEKNQYAAFLKTVKNRILKAQYDAFKIVNKELIALYLEGGVPFQNINKETFLGG